MIAAEIGKDIGDARLLQRLEHRRTGRVHSIQLPRFSKPIPNLAKSSKAQPTPSKIHQRKRLGYGDAAIQEPRFIRRPGQCTTTSDFRKEKSLAAARKRPCVLIV